MTRSIAALVLVLMIAGCEGRQTSPRAVPAADLRPNIVLVMVEDLGLRLGAYGDALAHTPNVDRLARAGARFTRAFTTAGVRMPG